MTPQELAQNVAAFIAHNGIDLTKISMDQAVKAYFDAQLQAIETAAQQVTELLEDK